MTGYTVHTGSSKKFAAGWDQIFKGQAKSSRGASSGETKPPRQQKSGGRVKK